jgi:signal transduction histidine kinase
MTPTEQKLSLRQLRFPTDLEASYRIWHYGNIRNVLRIAVTPIIAFALFSAVRDLLYINVPVYALSGDGAVIVLCLLLFALTFWPGFGRVWQPTTVILIWVAMTIMLNSPVVTGLRPTFENSVQTAGPAVSTPAVSGRVTPAPLAPPPDPDFGLGSRDQMLSVQLYTLMIFLAAFRFQFIWAMLLNSGLLLSAYWVLNVRLQASAQSILMMAERSFLVFFALMVSALVQERLSRTAFLANYLLDQERNDERQKRERTEGMLHVLGQAIGGIVHDLGNPLHVVQGSAQLLDQMLDEETDPATLKELAGMIEEGAELLNYQRLSLMEQTRVIEGRPIPVERKLTSVRRMIEAGLRYQKPHFMSGRQVVIEGDDLQLDVDEMKLTSVFMNLIGNALKYSDGEIRVVWRMDATGTWIAVLDQGMAGRGLSAEQAGNLFVAFSRLETHAAIEGTGLGLLSVRKILEAHGGEVYIEGHKGGDPTAPLFSTAQADYPSMLREGFLTAFVLVCPNQAS